MGPGAGLRGQSAKARRQESLGCKVRGAVRLPGRGKGVEIRPGVGRLALEKPCPGESKEKDLQVLKSVRHSVSRDEKCNFWERRENNIKQQRIRAGF